MKSYDRESKNLARIIANEKLTRRSSLLMMPGAEALCVRQLIDAKIIDANTPQQWIERKRSLMPALKKQGELLGLRKVTYHNCLLEEYDPISTVDYVNADTMGYMQPELALWIEQKLAPKLADHASICITLTQWTRKKEWREWATQFFYHGALEKQTYEFKCAFGSFDPDLVIQRLLLCCALHEFDVVWAHNNTYHDLGRKWGMTMLRVDDIQRRQHTPIWPAVSTLVKQFREGAKIYQPNGPHDMARLTELRGILSLNNMVPRKDFDCWVVIFVPTNKIIGQYDSFDKLYETFMP